MPSITEVKDSVQQIVTGALLPVNNHILGLIWGNDSTKYLFDSHLRDENINLSNSATAVLLKFGTLHSLENYMKRKK